MTPIAKQHTVQRDIQHLEVLNSEKKDWPGNNVELRENDVFDCIVCTLIVINNEKYGNFEADSLPTFLRLKPKTEVVHTYTTT